MMAPRARLEMLLLLLLPLLYYMSFAAEERQATQSANIAAEDCRRPSRHLSCQSQLETAESSEQSEMLAAFLGG